MRPARYFWTGKFLPASTTLPIHFGTEFGPYTSVLSGSDVWDSCPVFRAEHCRKRIRSVAQSVGDLPTNFWLSKLSNQAISRFWTDFVMELWQSDVWESCPVLLDSRRCKGIRSIAQSVGDLPTNFGAQKPVRPRFWWSVGGQNLGTIFATD